MAAMNVLYGIDEGKKDYARYLGVSILSLLENNKNEDVHIYILSKYIEESNKQELIRIVNKYGKKIYFSEGEIIPERFKKVLKLQGPRPMATYYRFFFLEKFNIKDRILYLDCDTIVNNNLSEFYYTDFGGNVVIGTSDSPIWSYTNSKRYGLSKYINAGVCLINVDLYRETDIYNGIIEVNKKFSILEYNDQDYLNIIFKDKIMLYKNLQYMNTYKRVDFEDGNYLVLHTVNKPNSGGSSLCSKKIEKIFDKYLSQTKWKSYIGWEKEKSIKMHIGCFVDKTRNFITYISLKYIGVEFASRVHKEFPIIINKLGGLLRKIKLIK